MSTYLSNDHDVIIAGAGPVGLLLACELRLGGCTVLLLEKADNATTPLEHAPFGMRGLSVATTENLDRRDLLRPLRDHAIGYGTTDQPFEARREVGHFAGIDIFADQINQDAWPWRPSRSLDSLGVDMAVIKAVLTSRAVALGIEIRRGCGIDGLTQTTDGVTVRAGSEIFQASWLVGCDGGRSAVRKASGIDFLGSAPEFTGYFARVDLDDPDELEQGRQRTATGIYVYGVPDVVAIADFDRGAFHRAAPITREHVESVLRRVSGTKVSVTALHLASTWTDRACQAVAYRERRILLAGDAAHIHSPLGGQGLNLGLGDAMNLGWKLSATIRGDAPADLLDTYKFERHPIARQVLERSRAQVALMRPDAGSEALESIIRDLVGTKDGATYMAGHVQGLTQRYDLGGDHPLIGRSAPDLALGDGTRLNEHLRDGRGALFDFSPHPTLRAHAQLWPDRVAYVSAETTEAAPANALLVRPDGIVAWADTGEGDALNALSRWFGKRSIEPTVNGVSSG